MKKIMLGSVFALTAFCTSAYAETTQSEFTAIHKIMSLCQTFKGQDVKAVIVYSNNANSIKDKDALVKLAASKNIATSVVDVANVNAIDANLVFVTEGLDAGQQAKVKGLVGTKPVISASTDLTCVESGNCMLGVDIGSVVKLLVDSNSYSNSGLKFDPAFEFMVKQI